MELIVFAAFWERRLGRKIDQNEIYYYSETTKTVLAVAEMSFVSISVIPTFYCITD